MRRHLLSALFLLLLMCFTTQCARAGETGQLGGADVFESGRTMAPYLDTSHKTHYKSVYMFHSPSLVEADGVVVAVAGAQYSGNAEGKTDIMARYMTLGENNWTTQIAVKKDTRHEFFYTLSGPRALVRNKKIHLLVGSNYEPKAHSTTRHSSDNDWDIEFVVGEVTTENGTKVIEWGAPNSLKLQLTEQLNAHNLRLLKGAGGSAIVTSTGVFLFLVEATKGTDGKTGFAMISSRDDGINWDLVLVPDSVGSCIHPAIAEWENNKLIMATLCEDGLQKVYESTDMGGTWTEALGTLSRVWGNTKHRENGGVGGQGGFISVEIEQRRVMLLTRPVEEERDKHRLHLWVTDNNRIYDVGPVSGAVTKYAFSMLLYSAGKLFLMYDMEKVDSRSYVVTLLDDELQRVKSVLGVWDTQDKVLSTPCTASGNGSILLDGTCDVPVPTNGLVGFLSAGGDSTHWADAYLCVNATVNRPVRRVINGFEFNGLGSGAQWPVGLQGQNQRYYFSNFKFTLVATVVIHEVPTDISPLLGLSLGEKSYKRRLGLWYDEKRRWKTTYADGEEAHRATWEPGVAYQVALVLEGERGAVYVEGRCLRDFVDMSGLTASANISHFSLGREKDESGNDAGHVTLTDVFLYNRPLQEAEFAMLLRRKERRAAEYASHGSASDPETPASDNGAPGHTDGDSGGARDREEPPTGRPAPNSSEADDRSGGTHDRDFPPRGGDGAFRKRGALGPLLVLWCVAVLC